MWEVIISSAVAGLVGSLVTFFSMRKVRKSEIKKIESETINNVIKMWKELVETLTNQSESLTKQVEGLTEEVKALTAENKLLRQEIHDFVLKSTNMNLSKAEGKAEGIAEKQVEVDELNKASIPNKE